MQSPADPADGADTIGVEAIDATYGASRCRTTRPTPVECELVEAHRRPTRTVPAASPLSTAPCAARRG